MHKNLASIARSVAVFCLTLTIGACGGGDSSGGGGGAPPPPPGTLIGSAGGTVVGPNGAKVVIPAGALTIETRINIEQTTAGAPPLPGGVTAFGNMFAFTPHGTTFAVPVSMTVPFDPALVPAGVTPAVYKTNAAMDAFELVAGAAVAGDTVTTQVSSFSLEVAGTPPPPPPPPLVPVGKPGRNWQFLAYPGDATGVIPVTEIRGQLGGVVDGDLARYEYGARTFKSPPPRNDFIALGQVFSSESGNKYSVLAESPRGAFSHADTSIGSVVEFNQVQGFRKNADVATLKIKITAMNLEGYNYNNDDSAFLPFDCTGVRECHLREYSHLSVYIAVTDGNLKQIFQIAGHLVLEYFPKPLGYDVRWSIDNVETGFDTFWNSGLENPITLIGDIDGKHLQVKLARPLTYSIPLGDAEKVFVFSTIVARANNEVQGESFISAYFQDPIEGEGATIETTGLVPIEEPLPQAPPASDKQAPECKSGVDPKAGTLQFAAAELATLESPLGAQFVVVTRTGGSEGAVSATFKTSDGTATAGADYTPVTKTVYFGDGDTSPRGVEIPLVLDTVAEPDKTVNLTLSDVRGCATLGSQSTAVLTILDNDRPPPARAFSVGGTVTGLAGSGLVLSHLTTGENLSAGNGPFTFARPLPNGLDYLVAVATQPSNPAQICTVTNGAGTIANANVSNVEVDCVTPPPNGSLDSGFGAGGKVDTGLAGGATALAFQSDGKIITVGKLKLTRHNANGTPDGSFGTEGEGEGEGEVTIRFNGGGSDAALDVAVQPDDKIVVAGYTRVGTNDDFAVARFNRDGSPDTGFGNNGTASVDFNAAADKAWSVLIQGDGKIVLAGHAAATSPLGLDNDFAVARFTNTGALDTGFGSGGKVRTNIAGRSDLAVAAALQADGKILLAGRVADSGGDNPDFGLVRYSGDGTPDNSFGIHGIQRQDMTDGNWDEATDLVIQPDGKIVAAGLAAVGGNFTFALARFDANGGRDNGFGTKGFVTTALSSQDDFGRGVALQAGGKIVVVGQKSNRQQPDFGVARYDTGGGLDASFGSGGMLSVDFFGAADGAEDIAIQPDGKLVVGGSARNGTTTDLGLVRINP